MDTFRIADQPGLIQRTHFKLARCRQLAGFSAKLLGPDLGDHLPVSGTFRRVVGGSQGGPAERLARRQVALSHSGDDGEFGVDYVGNYGLHPLTHEERGAAFVESVVGHKPALHFGVGVLKSFDQ